MNAEAAVYRHRPGDPPSQAGRAPATEPGSAALRLFFAPRTLFGAYLVALLAVPANLGWDVGPVISPARGLLILWLASTIASYRTRLLQALAPVRRVLGAWLVFLASAGISTIREGTGEGVLRWGAWLVEGCVLFLLTYVTVRRPQERIRAVRLLVLGTLGVALTTLLVGSLGLRYERVLEAIFGASESDSYIPLRLGFERQEASFSAPLWFGVWLSMAGVLLLPLAARSTGPRKLGWVLGGGVLTLTLLTTLSRVSVMALPALALLYAVLRRRGRYRSWVGATGLLAAATATLGVVLVVASVSNRELASSSFARMEAIETTVSALSERPLFGWGFSSVKEVAEGFLGHMNYVDSSYLLMLIQLGLVGFGSFVVLVLAATVPAAVALPRFHPAESAVFVALVGFLTMGLVVPLLASSQLVSLFSVLLAIMAASQPHATARSLPECPGGAKQRVYSGERTRRRF